MTATIIKTGAASLPATLPSVGVPYADDWLGLFLFGASDAESRKNRINPAAPLEPYQFGSAPTVFTANSAQFRGGSIGYQTPFRVTSRNYTLIAIYQYYTDNADGTNVGANHATTTFSPFTSDFGNNRPIFYDAGGGASYAQGFDDPVGIAFPQPGYVPPRDRQQFIGYTEAPTTLGLYAEEYSGLLRASAASVPSSPPVQAKIVIGAAPTFGSAYSYMSAFAVLKRAVSESEMNDIYLFLQRVQAARGHG